ncbi:nudC domain-containing protein 1 isoform X1 [Mobula birostris]|uniref:nudC domain-containing protein 1 isoform X1 n=1 Tax=Mobula birostris TaxID=1983395 RepID=UPI003B27BC32
MAAANCSLRVDRRLIDANFDSYRLSLEPLPTYAVELDGAVAEVKLREDQYTLDHMRVFGMYNYLHCDRWYQDSVYYVDQHERVMHLAVTLDTAISKPREVFRLSAEIKSCDTLVCASMHFTSPTWAALSDGTGRLYLLKTNSRAPNNTDKWEIMFQQELGEPFVIIHSHSFVKDNTNLIDVVLLKTEKDESNVKGSGFHSAIDWLTITCENNENKYEVSRHRTLIGVQAPHYAAVEQDGAGLVIASDQPFRFMQIDGKPVEEKKVEKMDTSEKKEPVYYWQQTDEDLTVNIQLKENTTKQNIEFQLSADHLNVGVKGQVVFIEGQLFSSVDHSESTWTITENRLEIFMIKKNKGVMWPEVVIGDRGGECIVNPSQTSELNERLLNLTSEELNADPERGKQACNAQELEECDRFPEDTSSLTRFDSNTLKATHVVNLSSHQYLFTAVVNPAEMPCLCLRHDVDALLWQPHTKQEDMWEHIGTFNALGYVQASKREKKFATCAPDHSYAALCECFRRVFIYRQPSPVQTVLYNRKEARHVGQVAKQQVANLETNDPVLGFQATNERLFVLTTKTLFVIKVNADGPQ